MVFFDNFSKQVNNKRLLYDFSKNNYKTSYSGFLVNSIEKEVMSKY